MIRERIVLDGANNTRDLGSMRCADGRRIKSGMLIRSGNLASLTDADVSVLNKYNIKAVIDLRTDLEERESPDIRLDGAQYYRLRPLTEAAMGVTHEKTTGLQMFTNGIDINGDPDKYMCDMYDKFMFSSHGEAEFARFFDILLNTDGCVLWHCSAGKDRAGMASLLIETALGAEREEIIEDYMLTEYFTREISRIRLENFLKIPGALEIKEFIIALMAVRPIYAEHVLDKMTADYGSPEKYLENALGLDADKIAVLKEKYTEQY